MSYFMVISAALSKLPTSTSSAMKAKGNLVVAYYPQRHGSAKSAPVPLTTEYHLMSDLNPSLYRAPSTSGPYSKVFGDFNAVHMNPYFAFLLGIFTHGMFTRAATRRYVETVVAKAVPDRVFK